jgi:L-aminopeptidase/D-esterase-like protein
MTTRARDLGVPFDGSTGSHNAITDVAGVEVGHFTAITDSYARADGTGITRTGVTVIHPKGRFATGGVAAGRATLNGTGEWTGMHLIDEIGRFYGPIALTGTGNLGAVHRALIEWSSSLDFLDKDERYMRLLAVVGETLDAQLNDAFSVPFTSADISKALDGATRGPVAEGNVGGGTGMVAYEFKGGIGTASRVISCSRGGFTIPLRARR